MTRRNLILTLLALSVCSSRSLANDQEKLQESETTWQQVREKHQGNYSYKVRWSSFVGFGHETEVIVRNNEVVERRFRSFSGRPVPVRPGQPVPEPEGDSWTEKGEALGSHKAGAPPKTLDQLYTQAAEVVARPLPEHERRYVRFDKQGLLLSCFTVDTRIADDAPTKGVVITSIKLGADADANEAKEGVVGKPPKAPGARKYPAHWGDPPRIQTRDLRPLPGGYGRGSSTLAKWIQMNLDQGAKREKGGG